MWKGAETETIALFRFSYSSNLPKNISLLNSLENDVKNGWLEAHTRRAGLMKAKVTDRLSLAIQY